MARRRLNVSQYRDILDRLRRGEVRRDICRDLKVSPRAVKEMRQLAARRDWLKSDTVPSDQELLNAVQAFNSEKQKLNVTQFATVLDRLRDGHRRPDICRELKVPRRRVREIRALAQQQGWLESAAPPPEEVLQDAWETLNNAKGLPQPNVTAPHRELIQTWLKKNYDAKTIWSALKRQHGFAGSYSSVWRLVQQLQAADPDVVVRLQFAPGEVGQVDFGSGPMIYDLARCKERKTWFFVMTLAFSRHQYAELVWDQSVETWLRCHSNAFRFFGGVVSKVIIDNLKSAITKACRYDPQVQRSYAEFARAYGFQISPCVVRTPEHKGRVEAGVKYIKRSFLNSPRTFRHLADGCRQLLDWVMGEAGNRVHGTTQQQPLALFAEEEKSALKPLPAEPVELAVWKTVKLHPDCHVQLNRSYYSAPHRYVGRELDLRATPNQVTLFDQLTLVACHPRATRPGTWMTNYDHLPPEKTAHLLQTPQWCLAEAEKVGEACSEFMLELLGDRVVDRLRAAQGLLRLRKKFGTRRLEAACRRALAFGNIQFKAVKRILDQGLDQQPLDVTDEGQYELPVVEYPRFARDIATLFRPN